MFRKLVSVLSFTFILAALILLTDPVYAADQVVNDCSNDTELRNDLTAMQAGGGGTLTFNCGTASIPLTGVLPLITNNATINGGGTITLSGTNSGRLFYIDITGSLTLQNIILEKGYDGGEGGAIYNEGSLTLNGATIRNSYAPLGGGAIRTNRTVNIINSTLHDNISSIGGAIYGFGASAITINNSVFHDNRASHGQPPNGVGGAIAAMGSLNVSGSEFYANTAGAGGALYANTSSANVQIVNSRFHDNISKSESNSAGGGAIFATDHASVGINTSTIASNTFKSKGGGILNEANMTIADSTISKNIGEGIALGGGIFNYGNLYLSSVTVNGNSAYLGGGIDNAFATMYLSNVTVSGNTAINSGGGIRNSDATANLTNVTFGGNSAGSLGGGIANSSGTTLNLKNVIVNKSKSGGNCYFYVAPTSSVNNLSSDDTCGFDGDANNVKLKLGPLETNGGFTLTNRLKPGSFAIDNGTNVGAPTVDQRGITRPQGSAVDVGAFEFQPCAAKPPKPKLLSPIKNAAVSTPQVLLDWAGPDCVAKFRVVVHRGSKTGSVVFTKDKIKATQVSTSTLPNNQTYFWQVIACNNVGCSSAWGKFKRQ